MTHPAPSHMRTHPRELTVLLLAALVCEREREITDTLVELLIATVHRIKARADSKVTKELINAFKRVTGKENILFRVADAALGRPDDPVRAVIFPAVTGGEQTLKDLVHEFKTILRRFRGCKLADATDEHVEHLIAARRFYYTEALAELDEPATVAPGSAANDTTGRP
jgi:hypothetical protein